MRMCCIGRYSRSELTTFGLDVNLVNRRQHTFAHSHICHQEPVHWVPSNFNAEKDNREENIEFSNFRKRDWPAICGAYDCKVRMSCPSRQDKIKDQPINHD